MLDEMVGLIRSSLLHALILFYFLDFFVNRIGNSTTVSFCHSSVSFFETTMQGLLARAL